MKLWLNPSNFTFKMANCLTDPKIILQAPTHVRCQIRLIVKEFESLALQICYVFPEFSVVVAKHNFWDTTQTANTTYTLLFFCCQYINLFYFFFFKSNFRSNFFFTNIAKELLQKLINETLVIVLLISLAAIRKELALLHRSTNQTEIPRHTKKFSRAKNRKSFSLNFATQQSHIFCFSLWSYAEKHTN